MPMPVFAEQRMAVGSVEADHIFDLLLDAFDIGRRKIDFIDDGDDLKIRSRARWTLARLCACTPCTASTTRSAPSQAERERETS